MIPVFRFDDFYKLCFAEYIYRFPFFTDSFGKAFPGIPSVDNFRSEFQFSRFADYGKGKSFVQRGRRMVLVGNKDRKFRIADFIDFPS